MGLPAVRRGVWVERHTALTEQPVGDTADTATRAYHITYRLKGVEDVPVIVIYQSRAAAMRRADHLRDDPTVARFSIWEDACIASWRRGEP